MEAALISQPRVPEIENRTIGRFDLRVARWRATEQSDGNSPILFFTGIAVSFELFAPFLSRFRDRDVITFDMPGLGGSGPPKTLYRPSSIAAAAHTLMRELGYTACAVIGVSWGGLIAQQYAYQYRGDVSQVVLIATTPGSIMIPSQISALEELRTLKRYTDPNYVRSQQQLSGINSSFSDGAILTPPKKSSYLHQIFSILGWTSLPMLPFVTSETLIITGGADPLVRPGNGRILQFFLPKAQLTVIDGAQHMLLLTHERKAFSLINDFLESSV